MILKESKIIMVPEKKAAAPKEESKKPGAKGGAGKK